MGADQMATLGSVPLRDVCVRITKGTTPTTLGRPFVRSGINFVKSEAITHEGRIDPSSFAFIDADTHAALARSILEEGDVLFSMAGAYLGKTAVVTRPILPANTNQAVGIVRADRSKAIPRFIHYALSSPVCRGYVQRSVAQSAQPNYNLGDIGNLPIPDLPLVQQRAIADVLGALDDKIELNRRTNETLEAMARALFQSWFVDFDPVQAKAAGIQPVGMDAETAELFPREFVVSDVGLIPRGWRVQALDDIAMVIVGQSPPGETYNESAEGMPLINGPAQYGGRFPKKTLWTTAERVKLSENGDLIFCVRGSTTGRRVRADDVYALGRGVCAIRSKVPHGQAFVDLSVEANLDSMLAKTTGSVFPNLSAGDILAHRLVVPEYASVSAFGRLTSPLVARIRANESASESLATLRDSLLPKLLSGELPIPEAETAVGKAL